MNMENKNFSKLKSRGKDLDQDTAALKQKAEVKMRGRAVAGASGGALSKPKNSPEFLQHILCQTKKVDNLKKTLKKISFCLGAVAIFLFVANVIGYL